MSIGQMYLLEMTGTLFPSIHRRERASDEKMVFDVKAITWTEAAT